MSVAAEPGRLYTPDDLLAMPDGEHYELVDGHLVEPNVSALSSLVESMVIYNLVDYDQARGAGWVLSSSSMYRCFPHRPNLIRKPDASVILRDRAGEDVIASRIITLVPDLAVEVVSPNDEAEELEIKIRDYLKAGVRLVWVIFPIARTARVHRADGTIGGLTEEDELDGEEVLPGFRCRLGGLIPKAQAPEG